MVFSHCLPQFSTPSKLWTMFNILYLCFEYIHTDVPDGLKSLKVQRPSFPHRDAVKFLVGNSPVKLPAKSLILHIQQAVFTQPIDA